MSHSDLFLLILVEAWVYFLRHSRCLVIITYQQTFALAAVELFRPFFEHGPLYEYLLLLNYDGLIRYVFHFYLLSLFPCDSSPFAIGP